MQPIDERTTRREGCDGSGETTYPFKHKGEDHAGTILCPGCPACKPSVCPTCGREKCPQNGICPINPTNRCHGNDCQPEKCDKCSITLPQIIVLAGKEKFCSTKCAGMESVPAGEAEWEEELYLNVMRTHDESSRLAYGGDYPNPLPPVHRNSATMTSWRTFIRSIENKAYVRGLEAAKKAIDKT